MPPQADSRNLQTGGWQPARNWLLRTTSMSTLYWLNSTSTQLFIFPSHNSTSTHLRGYALTQVPGWIRDLILPGPYPTFCRTGCTPHHLPSPHLDAHLPRTPVLITNGNPRAPSGYPPSALRGSSRRLPTSPVAVVGTPPPPSPLAGASVRFPSKGLQVGALKL
jgi:hypothetical protein